MNEDVKDLLQMIKNGSKYLDSRLTFDGGCCKCLLEYIDGLKERIEYLERSNNRREETILDLRSENVDLATKIDKAIEIIEGCNLGIFDYSIDQLGIIKLLEILKGDVDE